VNEVEKEKYHPDQMDPVDSVSLRVLNDVGETAEQVSHTQAHDHSEEHPDVKI
jgi:hypothetical protein